MGGEVTSKGGHGEEGSIEGPPAPGGRAGAPPVDGGIGVPPPASGGCGRGHGGSAAGLRRAEPREGAGPTGPRVVEAAS